MNDREVTLISLRGQSGMAVDVLNYGAVVQRVVVPDRDGKLSDVVLGFDDPGDYLTQHPYFGAVIGRFANRIANGRFRIDGREYRLATNDGANALHGGIRGFDKAWWDISYRGERDNTVTMHYVSRDGEEGYPGELAVSVTYTLTDNDELRIDYEAETDQLTPVNLTNHTYFNLRGAGNNDVLDHRVTLFADTFTPIDGNLVPTGEIRAVAGTPLDFREATRIGERIDAADPQLERALGYDHNWVLARKDSGLQAAALVQEPGSGRVLEVFTTEPGLQFYSGNFLDGSVIGKGGTPYRRRSGFCLETQHFPDSPNRPEFPSTLLSPGDVFRSTTMYRFSVAELPALAK